MYTYIENLEKNLAEDQKDMLKRIYEPYSVVTPLADSRRDLCIMRDGEIRSYGRLYANPHFSNNEGQTAYLSSKDCGLSWNIRYSKGKMNSCTYLEKADMYITSCDCFNNNEGVTEPINAGLFVYRSKIGPDDPNPEVIKLSDKKFADSFLPLQSAFSDRIWFTSQLNGVPYFFYSDDFGITWEEREISLPHCFETVFPHKGSRWCKGSGTEPYVTELSSDKMMMIIRTPMDCFYKSYSYDGGNSWSKPEPSTFYGTNTTAFLLRLSDGRILTFWNNTKPLPQPNLKALGAENYIVNGMGENGFTNRDAAHVAISDDGGETFVGYRELILNTIRNNADFRYIGGAVSSSDKSVHQFQAYELPFNKILVSAGQNIASRKLVIFDIDWLYETSRKEDFLKGLANVTSHTYVKSISGCQIHQIGNGHCALNRTNSAYLMPDPDGGNKEVLYISKQKNHCLVNEVGGVCWNFPASSKGKITAAIKIVEKQARFILSDRWYNACDEYAASQSPFWFELDDLDIGKEFVNININYDTENGDAEVFAENEFLFKLKMNGDCPTGISYLILQCITDGESQGFYVKGLAKE